MQPLVSIIIPTFNRAEMLVQAIESALAQKYERLQVIVSDNASTDSTVDVVRRFSNDLRLRYICNDSNIGMVRNWRKALAEAEGEYFVLLSDDDYFVDDSYVSKAVELFLKHDDVVMVYANGYINNVDSGKTQELRLPFVKIVDGKTIFLQRGKVKPQEFTLCNVMFQKKLALELNAFANEFNISCDSELFFKTCLCGSIGVIKDFVSVYRIHQGNLLKALKSDVRYLVNNYDCYYEPYRMAVDKQMLTVAEKKMVEEKLLFDLLKTIIHTGYVYHHDKYKEIVATLKGRDSDLYQRMVVRKVLLIGMFKARYKLRQIFGAIS